MCLKWISVLIFVVAVSGTPLGNSRAEDNVDYRLPTNIMPTKYTVDLVLNEKIFSTDSDEFTGTVAIEYEVKTATDTMYMHVNSAFLTITAVKLKGVDIDITKDISIDPTTNKLAIKGDFKPEDTDKTIILTFTAKVSTTDMYGFYKSSYSEKNNEGEDEPKFLLTTQFQSIHARRVFPCFDEPSFKAKFLISITYPKNDKLVALGNTKGETEDVGTSTTKVTFAETPVMSTYLIAFTISEFTKSGDDDGKPEDEYVAGVPHKVWSRPLTEAARSTAVEYGPKILKALSDYTAYPYKDHNLMKMDQVAIPDFSAGAMENWGLVTYRETALLWDENDSSNRYKQRVVTVIAHEFAHLWFGDLVTTHWWSDTFLNEGFATYFEFHITDKVLPEWKLTSQMVLEDHQAALDVDSSDTTHALSSEANSYAEISGKFDTISYSKGGSILRMVHHIMGEEKFQAGLKQYLKALEFKTTTPALLWEHLGKQADIPLPAEKSLADVMENYITKPGYPVINVKLNTNTNTVQLQQERFLITLPTRRAENTKWYVPISYTTSKEKDFESTAPKTWLLPDDSTLDIEYDSQRTNWIILNIHESAYYRVNYDPALWMQLNKALWEDDFSRIPELNRAQIVDDLFALSRAGQRKYTETLKYIDFLTHDTSYYPWFSAFNAFNWLLRKTGTESELGQELSKLISELMAQLYESVKDDKPEDQVHTLNRVLAYSWACKLGNKDCEDLAKTKFADYMASATAIPDRNLRGTIYCYGLRHNANQQQAWEFLWDKYVKADLQTEQVTILSALGCTTNEELLKAYLSKTITSDSGIRKQDAASAFSAVYTSGPVGLKVAYEFFKENIAAIQDTYASMNSMSNLINGIADRFTTDTEVKDFEAFIESASLSPESKLAVERALNTAKNNLHWLSFYEEDLKLHFGLVTNPATTPTGPTPTKAPGDDDSSGVISSLSIVLLSLAMTTNYLLNM